jgi:hypothetical protein
MNNLPKPIFSVTPKQGQPRVSVKDRKGRHMYYNVARSVVAIEGRCILRAPRDEFWGGKDSKEYRSDFIDSPTWAQVFSRFGSAMKTTRDYHHQFLEGVYLDRSAPAVIDGGKEVPVYRFSTGS